MEASPLLRTAWADCGQCTGMKPSPDQASPQNPVAVPRADVAADKHGRTVPIHPGGHRTLLELQAALEKAVGPEKARIQREIDQLQNQAAP